MGKVQNFMIVMALLNALSNAQSNDKCTKDVLILLDTSYSIGQSNFDNKIKPFLKQLGHSPELNVSPQGTHLAILAFSSVSQTKIRLPFHQGYGTQYLNAIDGFDWDTVSGDRTRTDVAFQKAGEIFNDRSPLNHRSEYDDVIILLTDGEPFGVRNVMQKTIAQAKILKRRGVPIIGLGVGSVNMATLRKISSPGEAVLATFDNIHTKLETLVRGSCQPAPALTCKCPAEEHGDQFILESDSSSREVSWDSRPQPSCSDSNAKVSLTSVIPNVQSGDLFDIGRHTIEYTYRAVSGTTATEVKCNIRFEVKVRGANLCSGKAYSIGRDVCCCGKIHEKRENYECCGTDYFSNSTKQCCAGSTLRDIDQPCFGPLCKCPAVNLGTRYMKEGDLTTSVTWAVPRPTCGGRLRTKTPDERPGQMFKPGEYRIDYLYQTTNQMDVTCTVRFEVKECSCPLPVLKTFRVTPGETTTAVTWTAPLSTCSEAIRNTVLPQATSGQLFAIGQHTVVYAYNINNQFDQRCAVMFEVRGALCRDKGYNSANEVCCCGTVHNIIQGYGCCGQDYYSLTTHQCCANLVVRDKAMSCPRQ
ncbi:Hypothetical predicted protein [Paramuricea clavata]|uniref:Uncharacterized protein n=1 Tax=Paramuricea clavata TaxID=317549 RepID=A0A6S7HWX0_PARCT|nr:Hypothetical predicted protein [Paramuricea clavata]